MKLNFNLIYEEWPESIRILEIIQYELQTLESEQKPASIGGGKKKIYKWTKWTKFLDFCAFYSDGIYTFGICNIALIKMSPGPCVEEKERSFPPKMV